MAAEPAGSQKLWLWFCFFTIAPQGLDKPKNKKGTAVTRSGWAASGVKCKLALRGAKYALYSDTAFMLWSLPEQDNSFN